MLRVIPGGNAKGYFSESLQREDYYTQKQEIVGEWHGRGAERLALSGGIEQEAFEALCENRKPGTTDRLTQRNRSDRTVGYDFNFHCPKSVSVVHALTQDVRVLEVFRGAVRQTMGEIESEAETRVRSRGSNENRPTGNLVWGEFVHTTARPVGGVPDPHLHAHCYVFNTTWDPVEEKWKAGQFRDLKANAPYYEAVFHARLAKGLVDLGYQVRRTGKGWEVVGVPLRVIEEFSRRGGQVDAKARELGITSAQGRDRLAAVTRERKQTGLSTDALRDSWSQRISPEEFSAIRSCRERSSTPHRRVTEREAMDHAIAHCYERASIATPKQLLREALRHGVGDVELGLVRRQLLRPELMEKRVENRTWITTQEVLAEEQRLIAFVQSGRGSVVPLCPGWDSPTDTSLSEEQRRAVKHVGRSRDRVIAIRGGAGTGKTTMMREAVRAIESGGRKVFVFAPSAEASRGVLRTEGGFADANTVAMLLGDPRLQEAIRGQVLWIDEAGLLGTRSMGRVMELAQAQDCRVILSGDTTQHRAVERGDALRLLENHAGLVAAELRTIRRQKADAHKAVVANLRAGNAREAFSEMDRLCMVRELPPEDRDPILAKDYVAAIRSRKSALVISPTHAEGDRVTGEIRKALRAAGLLRGEEREVGRLTSLQWTQAQRSDPRGYETGQIIRFHQNAPGFRRGEQLEVLRREGDRVGVRDYSGGERFLPLEAAQRFEVFERRALSVSAGERIRITRNGVAAGGERLNNGEIRSVEGFTREGDVRLTNGWVIPKDYGGIAHGYCVTSYAAQSKGVDAVFVAQGAESLGASDREQFYVSLSRFKESLTVYTDDRKELLAAVAKSSARRSATDLVTESQNPSVADSRRPETRRGWQQWIRERFWYFHRLKRGFREREARQRVHARARTQSQIQSQTHSTGMRV